MQKNETLESVDLSWNGFSLWEAKKITTMLTKNKTLKAIDFSFNRLDFVALELIIQFGLIKNTTLQKLKV